MWCRRGSFVLGLGLASSLSAQHSGEILPGNSEDRAAQKNSSACDDIEGNFCQEGAVSESRSASQDVAKRLRDAFVGSTADRRADRVQALVAQRAKAAGHVLDPRFSEEQKKYLLTPLHYRDPKAPPPVDPQTIPLLGGRDCRLSNGQDARTQNEFKQVRAQIEKRLFELGDRNFFPDLLVEAEVNSSKQHPELWVAFPSTLSDWQTGPEGRRTAMEALIQRRTEISQRVFEKFQTDLSSFEALWKEAFLYCQLSKVLNPSETAEWKCPDPKGARPQVGYFDFGYQLQPDTQSLETLRNQAQQLVNRSMTPNDSHVTLSPSQREIFLKALSSVIAQEKVDGLVKRVPADKSHSFKVSLEDVSKALEEVTLVSMPPFQAFETFSLCQMLAVYELEDFNQIRDRVATDASLERSVIDRVRQEAFPEEQQDIIQSQFKNVKARILTWFERHADPGDPALARIQNTELYWPDSSRLFSKGSDGVERLDLGRVDPHDVFHQAMMSDPYFLSGSMVNALFQTPESHGFALSGSNPRVLLLPGMIQFTKDQPMAQAFVLAHELGHALDPLVAKTSGRSDSKTYHKALECLKASSTGDRRMGMHDHQQGECFADLVAAEVIAGMVFDQNRDKDSEVVPMPASPKDRALQALKVLCSFRGSVPRLNEVHPHPRLRINAIFGAHPKIRLALGCSEKGPFPYCGEGLQKELNR